VRLPLLTSRLQLRMFRPEDAEPLMAVFGDPEVMRFVGATGQTFDRLQLPTYLERRQAHWDEHGFGLLAVVELDGEGAAAEGVDGEGVADGQAADERAAGAANERTADERAADDHSYASRNDQTGAGRVVGECGIELLDGGPEVELGYTFARSAWGRGYATEAAAAVLRAAFDEMGMERIVACVRPPNVASHRVAEKIGMRRDGTAWHYGAQMDMYALSRDDWRGTCPPP